MKNRQNKLYGALLLLVAMSITFAQTANSQSVWVQDFENKAKWGIELLTPSYSYTGDDRGVDFASYLYTNIPLGEKWGLKLQFPISRFDGGGSKLGSGNPFIGMQYINRETGINFDFGAWLPLLQPTTYTPLQPKPPAAAYRITSFRELKTAVRFNFHYRWGGNSGWVFKGGPGLKVIAPAAGGAALLVNYFAQALYKFDNLTLGGGIKGHLLRNESHYLFPQRNRLQFGISSFYDFGKFDFGLYLKQDIISGYNNNIPFVIGFSFRFAL